MKPRCQEHEVQMRFRAHCWVTFVMAVAAFGTVFHPEGNLWLNFMASMFWIWRD